MQMTLAQRTITGVFWSFGQQIGNRGIGILVTLILARFLEPSDYGLVAMMGVFLAVATSLMDSGFKEALIRIEDASRLDLNTAFYSNLALGAFSYTLLFLSAPLISSFYNEPHLTILIRVAGVSILISSFYVVQSAVLNRALNFKAELQATMPAGIISGVVAVGLAYFGFGVWALILASILGAVTTTVLLWYIQGWRPAFVFSWRSFRNMYNFGYKLFLSGLLDTIFRNLYVVVIARFFTASVAGHYFFANKLKELVISQLVGTIQKVTYPALSSIQGDNNRLKAGYRNVIQVTTFILFPSILILAALAEPLFLFLLPDKWLPAVLYLQLMCIAGVMYPLHAVNLNILKVKGRSDLFLYLEIFKKILVVIVLFVSIRYGVVGILLGQIATSFLAYIPNSLFSARLINYSIREQITDFLPCLFLSGTVAAVIYIAEFILQWPYIAELMTLGLVAALLYIGGSHVFKLHGYILARKIIWERMNKRV